MNYDSIKEEEGISRSREHNPQGKWSGKLQPEKRNMKKGKYKAGKRIMEAREKVRSSFLEVVFAGHYSPSSISVALLGSSLVPSWEMCRVSPVLHQSRALDRCAYDIKGRKVRWLTPRNDTPQIIRRWKTTPAVRWVRACSSWSPEVFWGVRQEIRDDTAREERGSTTVSFR